MKFNIPSLDAKRVAALAVTLVTVAFWLVIASYPKAYLFNPLDTKIVVFKIEQIFSFAGWVLTSFVPLALVWLTGFEGKATRMLFIISTALWPAAIFVIQVTLAIQGAGFYAYLGKHPIFAFNDLIAPLVLLALSSTLFESKATKTTRKTSSR